jgi:hypothetical protein
MCHAQSVAPWNMWAVIDDVFSVCFACAEADRATSSSGRTGVFECTQLLHCGQFGRCADIAKFARIASWHSEGNLAKTSPAAGWRTPVRG